MRAQGDMRRIAGLAAASFFGFFLLGYAGVATWGGHANSASPIWPANALGLVLLLRLPRNRREDLAILSAILAAGLIANALSGASPALVLGFSLINLAEVALGVAGVRRFGPRRLRDLPSLGRFVALTVLVPSIISALLTAALMRLMGLPDPLLSALQWLLANMLGALMILPLGLTLSRRRAAKLRLSHRIPEALVLTLALAAIAIAGFHFGYPVLFLGLIVAGAMAVRFRLLGAGAALLLVATIAFVSVHFGHKPDLAWVGLLQFYLACISVISVRAALLLNERDLHMVMIERRHRRAVRAARFKSQLLAHVSHEVRQPLAAIIGFSSLLESGGIPEGRAGEFAAIIGHNGELLQRLHSDLLDLAKAEAGALALETQRVAVAPTLHSCVRGIRLDATLAGKDVLIEADDTLALQADPVRLAQILNNLIANAFKYGDNRSPIRLRAHALDARFGRIEVVNSGPGIPLPEQAGIFQPFRRGALAGRNVPGAGLGLSIARMLAQAQGGEVAFESVPGRITRFWVDLPLAA